MPLQNITPIDAQSAWALWNITEDTTTLWQNLSPKNAEKTFLESIKHKERQEASLAARLCIKAILEQHWGFSYQGMYKNENLHPFLQYYPFSISISHTQNYAVGIVHQTQAIGIDIEPTREKIIRIAPKFLSEAEANFAQNDLDKLTLIWTVKEALYKLYGEKNIIFSKNLHIAPFEVSKPTGQLTAKIQLPFFEQTYLLTYHQIESYFWLSFPIFSIEVR